MFAKSKVSQSLIDAVNSITSVDEAIKIPTATGTKVLGRSYGNSAKAHLDQTKKDIDTLKGPKSKDLVKQDKDEHEKTKGRYDEELKGDQHKIDANKNNKVDAHDFAILRSKKKVKEDYSFAARLIAYSKLAKEVQEEAYEPADSDVTTDTLKGREEGGKSNAFTSFKLKLKGSAPKTPDIDDPEKGMTARDPHVGHGGLVSIPPAGVVRKEEVELDEASPVKNQDVADKSYLKDMGKKPTVKSDLKNFGRFLAGKKETNESFEFELTEGSYNDLHKKWSDTHNIEYHSHTLYPKHTITKFNNEKDAESHAKKTGGTVRMSVSPKMSNEDVELEEAVSRKDFQMVADLIKTHDNHDKRKELATHHAEIFHRQNPRFDRAKFMKAADVNEGKQPETNSVPFITDSDKPPFDGPYTKTPSNVKDKSGAIHTPMSRAKDLARQAMKKVKTEMLGKAPGNNG